MKISKIILDNFGDICRNELYRLFEDIAEKYGEKYGFSTNDLMNEFLPEEYELLRVVEKTTKNRIKDKRKLNLKRCIARTWAGGKGTQCKRMSLVGTDYCKTHINELNRHGELKKGTIFGKNLSKKFFNEHLDRQKKKKERIFLLEE